MVKLKGVDYGISIFARVTYHDEVHAMTTDCYSVEENCLYRLREQETTEEKEKIKDLAVLFWKVMSPVTGSGVGQMCGHVCSWMCVVMRVCICVCATIIM